MKNLLEVKNITKEYSSFKLDDISFEIPKGTIMGMIGENGAGKSTLINAILGLIEKEGQIIFDGEELTSDSNNLKEDIGVVFDEISFHQRLNIKKIEKISKLAYTRWDSELFFSYMDKFNLPLKKEIKEFSKGMKMKLSIALALSHKPRLLILDEATSGLDPVMRSDILDIFWGFVQNENHSILIASHISSDLEKICDYITFIHDGKLLISKTKDELIYNYGILRVGKAAFDMVDKSDIIRFRKKDYEYEILVSDKKKAKLKYKKDVVDNVSIDDILLLYIKGESVE